MDTVTERDVTIARLHEELDVAPLRARFVMSRLAMSVRTMRVPVRDGIEALLEKVLADEDSNLSRAQFLLGDEIGRYLAPRRGQQRSSQQRAAEAAMRLRRAREVLGNDEAIWRYEMREAFARALMLEGRGAALGDMWSLLQAAGYPERRNFQLSIHAMNLAVQLSRTDDDANQRAAKEILDQEAKWRTEQFGADHPFTLVAEANRIVHVLQMLERIHDSRTLSQADISDAQTLAQAGRELHDRRVAVLGERHPATTRALSYEARALRILGMLEDSRAQAERVLSQRGIDPETLRDDDLPAIMSVLIADALVNRYAIALGNARRADAEIEKISAGGRDRWPERRVDDVLRRLERTRLLEFDRANQTAAEIEELLNRVTQTLSHQEQFFRWIDRAAATREALIRHKQRQV